MDLTKLCRSCMKEVASWEKENFDARAVEMFCFCTNIEIKEQDKLPKQFCYDCIIKIEASYTFIKEAQNVNVTMKNIASRSGTSVIVELENCTKLLETTSTRKCHLKLTLPDYKLCSTFDNSSEKLMLDNKIKSVIIPNDKPSTDPVIIAPENPVTIREIKDKDVNDSDSVKKNVCTICRKAFVSKVWYSKHMEKEHSGQKYSCSYCAKTFSKASQLSYHSATHSDERKFSCSACGKRYKRRKQLNVHARTHSDERPYACDKCEKRFKLKSVLKCHMKVHDGLKQYLCSYCGWAFAQAGNLSVHLRRHTGAPPPRGSRHARPAPRALLCAHCSQRCRDSSALARHTRTHTGELPYRCARCPRAFADSWKRKTHLMRAHRLALHDIPRMRRDGTPLHPHYSS